MEEWMNRETSGWDPVGWQSHPVEPGQRPEACLAWSSVTAAAKRRQSRRAGKP